MRYNGVVKYFASIIGNGQWEIGENIPIGFFYYICCVD